MRKLSQFQILTHLIPLVLLYLVTACTTNTVNLQDEESIYQMAERAMQDEKFVLAIERFRDFKTRFPLSTRILDAELRIADAFYEMESYFEAASSYEIFAELHPNHPKLDYVRFRAGLCYYNQIPDNTARDLGAAYRAIEAFQQFLDRYPSSEYVAKAKEYLDESKRKIAEHENDVAAFYFRRKHYLSASYRYQTLLQDFPNLGYDEEGMYRLGECYYHTKMYKVAQSTLEKFIQKFPESSYRSDAESLLAEIRTPASK